MIKISLIKPIINLSSTTFDATKDFLVEFIASSGSQIYANEIEIFLNSDNSLVYSNKTIVPYFSLSQIIPADTLQNGTVYKIHLRSYDSGDLYSVWSDFILIRCYSSPTIDITNVVDKGTINNQSYQFQASYSQAENVLLQNYQYILYDSNMIELENSNVLYDGLLQYEFGGFSNNTSYYIKLIITTQYGVSIEVIKNYTVDYVLPNFSNLVTLTNNPNQASIDVNIQATRILGQITGTVTIENEELADLTNGTVYFDSNNGFTLPSGDWVYQFWGSNLVDTKSLINGVLEGILITKFYGHNNVIFELQYYDGCFHLYKYIGSILFSHYISNVINATIDNSVYLFCQSINNRISLQAEILN